ncbi:hypothetical protein OEG84_21605 [Hoeflea sp. G2-23]|uniref:Hypersensitivity response secretion-like HrpJ domain-containing protein n=1 Tax=Hoeflea algicola TaxID=2983763 RepID=A0ABT3ZG32_9HYPH|nr:hypothetical protein [Hoeflea algicola]MCY0150229.1 hypothetical protein [Hoeflea algicola]
MQSIVSQQADAQQSARETDSNLIPNVRVASANSPQTTEKLNDYYFGDHMSVTEVQVKLFGYLATYLNKQISAQDDAAAAGEAPDTTTELSRHLASMDQGKRESLGAALGGFNNTGDSARGLALKISLNFNLDELSRSKKLENYLEQMIGFDLKGMTVADLVKSFLDPEGSKNQKVRDVISEALAGQHGSKVSQRLEDAIKGLRSVAETKQDIADKKPYDEIDAETKAEDEADIDTAKAFETLTKVSSDIESADETKQQEAVPIPAAEQSAAAAARDETPADTSEPDESDSDAASGQENRLHPGYAEHMTRTAKDSLQSGFAPLYL